MGGVNVPNHSSDYDMASKLGEERSQHEEVWSAKFVTMGQGNFTYL
jgi:hypothetical protein